MRNKIKQFINAELAGWTPFEVIWLAVSCAIMIALSVYWQDTLMGIISATTGVMYVVLAGKGKLSAYIFGLVNCVLYAIISYNARLYGETMLNLYYIPMQFVGFYTWSKHMDADTAEVAKKKMTARGRLLLTLAIVAATAGYGLILNAIGGTMPFVDAFTTMASVIAMIISVRMYTEQWYIWFAVDFVSVIMWAVVYARGEENIATLLMWILYLANAVIMGIKWERAAKIKNRKDEIAS